MMICAHCRRARGHQDHHLVAQRLAVRIAEHQPGLVRRFVVKTVFPCVASRANMLYLAARTHNNRATVCLHEARIVALREFWTDWLPCHGNTVLTAEGLGSPGTSPTSREPTTNPCDHDPPSLGTTVPTLPWELAGQATATTPSQRRLVNEIRCLSRPIRLIVLAKGMK